MTNVSGVTNLNRQLRTFYRFLDYAVCLFGATPCVVLGFRGLWVLEDVILFPKEPDTSCVMSFCLGHLTILAFYLGQDIFVLLTDPSKKPLLDLVVPVYKFLWSVAFINQWRCIWIAYELLLGVGFAWALKAFVLSVFCLAACRTLPLVNSAPPHVFAKPKTDVFRCVPLFNTQLSRSLPKNLLDCCFSVLVVQTLVVVFWRAAWTLVDVSLKRTSFPVLQLAPLTGGIVASLFSYFIQNRVHALSKCLKGFTQICCQNLWYTFGGLCCVSIWHGLWSSLDYVLGVEPLVSLCTFLSSLYLLSSLFGVSMLYVQDIVKDGSVLLEINYFSDTLTSLNDGKERKEVSSEKLSVKLLDTLENLPKTDV